MDSRIKRFVYRVRARLREQLIIDNLIRFAGIGLLIAVIISLISLVVPFYYAILVAAGVIILSFLGGIFVGIRRTPTPMEAALIADAKGYQEKLSTAFFLRDKEDVFSMLQKKDAVKIVDRFDIRKDFPIQLQWKRFAVVIVLSVAFVISSMLDSPARDQAFIRHDVKQDAKEEIARIEKVEKEITKNTVIPQNEAAEINEQLEQAKKELEEAQSYEELTKAKERITKKIEMASEKVENKTLGEVLQAAAKESKEAAEQKEKDLVEEAQEALEKAADGSEKDKEKAYEKLKKLANVTGNENLAEAAEQYKDSNYAANEYATSVQALEQAIQDMATTQSDMASNSQDNNQQASNTSQGNSSNASQSSNQSNRNQSGQNAGNNQANDSEQGSGNNSSQGAGSGQGSGANSNPGSGGTGAGSGSGAGWNYGGKNGQEGARKTNEDITVPDGEVGDDENLTGKANGNDTSTKQKSNQSKTWSGNKVSYGEVSGEYKEKAYKKVNGSNYPGKLKDKIKNYFDGLN